MQGWTPDFIPKLAEDAVKAGLIDEVLPIKGGDALRLSRELAQKEGIFTGITGGATFAGALQICARAEKGAKVLCMLPDTGERYLSTPLFEDIPAEMTGEEIEISQSTPRYRFDVKPAPRRLRARGRGAVAAQPGSGGIRHQGDVRYRSAGRHVCARMVRILLVGTQAVQGVRHSLTARSISILPTTRRTIGAAKSATCSRLAPILRPFRKSSSAITISADAPRHSTRSMTDALQELMRDNGIKFKQADNVNAYSFLPKWLHPR